MNKSSIRWTNRSWNPVHGCSKVSDGCKHCYAMNLSLERGWTTAPWTIQNEDQNVLLKPHKLTEPYTLKEPERIFTNSMSDMFHRSIPDWYRAVIFCVMLDTPQHIYQVLTKRSDALEGWEQRFRAALETAEFKAFAAEARNPNIIRALQTKWQSPWAAHIWQGVSVEDNRVIHRIEDLKKCGAHIKFISAEPLLGSWGKVNLRGIDWVIVGGESGQHMTLATKETNTRWMQMAWAREIKDLCVEQGIAFFYKQDSAHTTEVRPYLVEEDGSRWKWEQYPGDLSPAVNIDTGDLLHMPTRYAGYSTPLPDYDMPWEGYTPPSRSISLYTGRIDCGDPDALDITVKSASTDEGKAFAPLWDMVKRLKGWHGWEAPLTETEYTEAYLKLLRERYSANPAPFHALLRRKRVVFTCYCAEGEFCHRHLAVNVLEKLALAQGMQVIRGGEVQRQQQQPAAKQADQIQQLSLF